jgi:hypothetical protein
MGVSERDSITIPQPCVILVYGQQKISQSCVLLVYLQHNNLKTTRGCGILQHNLTAMRGLGILITQQSPNNAWFWYTDNTTISQPRMGLVYLGYNTTIS